MEIRNCIPEDLDQILQMHDYARQLQRDRNMVVWPDFGISMIEEEIQTKRAWKILIDDHMACCWAITERDQDIWEEKENGDSIYIHRIATHPDFRGNRFIDQIVSWAKQHALQNGKEFIRLDTLGNNTKLIQHYTSAGFTFLGIHRLKNTSNLPLHYQHEPDCCLFEMELNTRRF